MARHAGRRPSTGVPRRGGRSARHSVPAPEQVPAYFQQAGKRPETVTGGSKMAKSTSTSRKSETQAGNVGQAAAQAAGTGAKSIEDTSAQTEAGARKTQETMVE